MEHHSHWNKIAFSRPTAQSPQPQISNRHQVDDNDSNHSLSVSKGGSRGAAASGVAAVSVPDELGPLPPGWQQSKTENDRLFFIDHINKKTTWVR